MRILITGKGGKAGSWKMRGEQLGHALGAVVHPNAQDAQGFDVAVVVKRTPEQVLKAVEGRPWVWDIVDAYPQPAAYKWTRDEAINWVRWRIEEMRPSAIIWPTHKMREDCDTGLPGIVLPHHHRIGIEINPIREAVQTVGYEGAESYLGDWREVIEAECEKRGWQFVVNPSRLADLDIVLALRDGGGYVSGHWKSGVKLANAHASGTPFIGQAECGYLETASGSERWIESRSDLSQAFDSLTPHAERMAVARRFLPSTYCVDRAADELMGFLRAL